MRLFDRSYDQMKISTDMLRKLLFAALLFAAGTAFAQNNQYTSGQDSDPEARVILEQLRQKYEAYDALEAAFKLEIEFPEQPVEVQEGTLARQGDRYRVKIATQEIFSDGQALYLVLHNNESVQINDLPDPDDSETLLTPQSLFNFYENGDFVYTLLDERSVNGRVRQYVEFKPLDRDSEYAKLRMEIDKANREVVSVKAFAKDGSRYTFSLTSFTPNKRFAANYFSFSESKFPGYYVEDLRE